MSVVRLPGPAVPSSTLDLKVSGAAHEAAAGHGLPIRHHLRKEEYQHLGIVGVMVMSYLCIRDFRKEEIISHYSYRIQILLIVVLNFYSFQ